MSEPAKEDFELFIFARKSDAVFDPAAKEVVPSFTQAFFVGYDEVRAFVSLFAYAATDVVVYAHAYQQAFEVAPTLLEVPCKRNVTVFPVPFSVQVKASVAVKETAPKQTVQLLRHVCEYACRASFSFFRVVVGEQKATEGTVRDSCDDCASPASLFRFSEVCGPVSKTAQQRKYFAHIGFKKREIYSIPIDTPISPKQAEEIGDNWVCNFFKSLNRHFGFWLLQAKAFNFVCDRVNAAIKRDCASFSRAALVVAFEIFDFDFSPVSHTVTTR